MGVREIIAKVRFLGFASFTWNGNLNVLMQDEDGTGTVWLITEDGGGFSWRPSETLQEAADWLLSYEQEGHQFLLV